MFEPHQRQLQQEFDATYPTTYDYLDDGEVVSQRLAGRRTPVPPAWVREYASVPPRTEFATLSKEIADLYPADVREVLVRYVKQWPFMHQHGLDLLIGGEEVKRQRSFAAAAVMNEITMRYGTRTALTTAWFDAGTLAWLQQVKTINPDVYAQATTRFHTAKLLLIDNPLKVERSHPLFWYLDGLYSLRFEYKRPTITTLAADLTHPKCWIRIREQLGPGITEILSDNYTWTPTGIRNLCQF